MKALENMMEEMSIKVKQQLGKPKNKSKGMGLW